MKIHSVEEDVYILAIESSCDETAAAVVSELAQRIARMRAEAEKIKEAE